MLTPKTAQIKALTQYLSPIEHSQDALEQAEVSEVFGVKEESREYYVDGFNVPADHCISVIK